MVSSKVAAIVVLWCAASVLASGFASFPRSRSSAVLDSFSTAGEPLFVSDYLDDPVLAKKLSRSPLGPGDEFTYSGFINVNKQANSNMFYWFFPAQNGDKNAPILLWLQGGPGGTSLFGLFVEIGPLQLTATQQLTSMNITWNSEYALLFIDNPVGTGFSFTDDLSAVPTDMDGVSRDLYSALSQFFTIYSEYRQNDFYITGESYAGKYIPALAFKIWQENQSGTTPRINLKGLAIGDGLSDPITQSQAYATMAYGSGCADLLQADVMRSYQDQIADSIRREQWPHCSDLFADLVNGDNTPSYFTNITGSPNYYDIRRTDFPPWVDPTDYVNSTAVRAKLHVGDRYFQDGSLAANALNNDICRTVKPLLPTLLEHYRVLFYNGQFDFIVGPLTTELFLNTIPWRGLTGFMESKRTIWKVVSSDAEVAGFVRQYENLTQIVVRNAGHILPYDQPRAAKDMITRFVQNRSWSN